MFSLIVGCHHPPQQFIKTNKQTNKYTQKKRQEKKLKLKKQQINYENRIRLSLF